MKKIHANIPYSIQTTDNIYFVLSSETLQIEYLVVFEKKFAMIHNVGNLFFSIVFWICSFICENKESIEFSIILNTKE